MKQNFYTVFLSLVLLSACDRGNVIPDSQKENAVAEENSVSGSILSVNEAGYDLQVSLTSNETSPETRFTFDPSFGHIDFFINENFHFTLVQDNADLNSIKLELEQGGLFSYKFYDYSDNELIYQTVLPDGTELGYNLIRKTTVKGKDYVFKSNSQQEFSKEDIERAQLILNKIS